MTNAARRHTVSGFTLIELIIVVVVTAILASIAMGAYGNYILSSKLSESFTILGDYRLRMEQFRQDNRTYTDNLNNCGVDSKKIYTNKYFDFTCAPAASGAQYTVTATNKAGIGLGNAGDYSYSIDQDGTQNTSKFAGAAGPSGVWKSK